MTLAKETKARGWWHAYGDVIPAWFNVFVGLEEAPLPVRAPRLSGDLAIVGVSNGSQVRLALARTGVATSSPADLILLRNLSGARVAAALIKATASKSRSSTTGT